MSISCDRAHPVKARSRDGRVPLWKYMCVLQETQQHATMDSTHPDERPLKKRRFFTEDSSPEQVRTKRQPSPTPPPNDETHALPPPDPTETQNAGDTDAFDVAMLQAVVGDLPAATIDKLKDVSGNNVERGITERAHVLDIPILTGKQRSTYILMGRGSPYQPRGLRLFSRPAYRRSRRY